MAVRDILVYPQGKDVLRKKSRPVRRNNRRARELVRDLKDTLNNHPAVVIKIAG